MFVCLLMFLSQFNRILSLRGWYMYITETKRFKRFDFDSLAEPIFWQTSESLNLATLDILAKLSVNDVGPCVFLWPPCKVLFWACAVINARGLRTWIWKGKAISFLHGTFLRVNLKVYGLWETFKGAPRPRPGQHRLWPPGSSRLAVYIHQIF